MLYVEMIGVVENYLRWGMDIIQVDFGQQMIGEYCFIVYQCILVDIDFVMGKMDI